MGRPLNKRYFGLTKSDGVNLEYEENLSVVVKIGSNPISAQGIIIKQSSGSSFMVNDSPDGTGNTGVCRLVDTVNLQDDEMVLIGIVNGSGKEAFIRKVHNRTMIDYDNNRYTWEIQDDSTVNELVLFEI